MFAPISDKRTVLGQIFETADKSSRRINAFIFYLHLLYQFVVCNLRVTRASASIKLYQSRYVSENQCLILLETMYKRRSEMLKHSDCHNIRCLANIQYLGTIFDAQVHRTKLRQAGRQKCRRPHFCPSPDKPRDQCQILLPMLGPILVPIFDALIMKRDLIACIELMKEAHTETFHKRRVHKQQHCIQ